VNAPALLSLVMLAGAGTDSVFVPDPTRFALVKFALQDFDEVRVFTDSTRFFSRRVIASPEGVRLRRINWGRSITDHPEERVIPWSEVESITVRRGARGTGPLAGAAIGFAIGSLIYLAQLPTTMLSLGQHQPSGAPILVGLVGGAALGALIDRPGPWRTVYP